MWWAGAISGRSRVRAMRKRQKCSRDTAQSIATAQTLIQVLNYTRKLQPPHKQLFGFQFFLVVIPKPYSVGGYEKCNFRVSKSLIRSSMKITKSKNRKVEKGENEKRLKTWPKVREVTWRKLLGLKERPTKRARTFYWRFCHFWKSWPWFKKMRDFAIPVCGRCRGVEGSKLR